MRIFLLLITIASKAQCEICSFERKSFAIRASLYVTCRVESNFSEMLMPGSTRPYESSSNVLLEDLVIYPNHPLVLDQSLDTIGYLKYLNDENLTASDEYYSLTSTYPVQSLASIQFSNINGIDTNYSYCQIYSDMELQDNMRIEFTFSHFKPIYNGRPLLNRCELDAAMVESIKELVPLRAAQVVFDTSTRYYLNTCSIILNNAKIDYLELAGISSSFLGDNSLGFDSLLEDGHVYPLNVSINNLVLQLYTDLLDSRLLNEVLFKSTEKIDINGRIDRSEPCLMDKYKHIVLRIVNLRTFLGSDIIWCDNQNQTTASHYITIAWEQMGLSLMNLINYLNQFAFLDEDLCLFRKYPIDDRHFFLFATKPVPNCTCSIFWLVHNHRLNLSVEIINEVYPRTNMFSICTENKTYDEWMEECDFDSRFAKCDLNQSTRSETEWTAFETTTLVAGLKYALAVVLLPIVCVIGLVTSCLQITVLRKMIAKLAEKPHDDTSKRSRLMYSYLLQHAVGSAAVCALFAFKPLTDCVMFGGIFCSPVYTSWHTRLFEAIGLNLLGTALKLHTTTTALLFSLARLAINVKNKKRRSIRIFSRMRPAYVSLACFLVSLTLSSVKLFASNDYSAFSVEGDALKSLKIPNFSTFTTYSFTFFRFCSFYYFNLSLEILLDFLLPLITVSIDLILLKLMRQQKASRSKVSTKLQAKCEDNEKQFTKMIISNGIFNFFFRIPSLASNTFEFVVYQKFAFYYFNFAFCRFEDFPLLSVCPSLLSISHLFLQVGFIIDFCLLLRYNKHFRHICCGMPLLAFLSPRLSAVSPI
nr:G protein-coupled receptor [Proales similis]